MSAADEPSKPRQDADADFLDRLAELDRNLPISHKPETGMPNDAATGLAERRKSSATARPASAARSVSRAPRRTRGAAGPDSAFVRWAIGSEAAPGIDRPLDAREDDQDTDDPSPRRVASLVAALFVLVAAGATAAAYLFRGDIAAILSVLEVP